MKVPPKRKGNVACRQVLGGGVHTLNESPSEKEGKYDCADAPHAKPAPQ